MIRRPPRSTQSRSSAASDVYKRQYFTCPSLSVLRASCASRWTKSSISSRKPTPCARGHREWWRGPTQEQSLRLHVYAIEQPAWQRKPDGRKELRPKAARLLAGNWLSTRSSSSLSANTPNTHLEHALHTTYSNELAKRSTKGKGRLSFWSPRLTSSTVIRTDYGVAGVLLRS